MKKLLKILLICSAVIFAVIVIAAIYFTAVAFSAKFDESKITGNKVNLQFYDREGNEIISTCTGDFDYVKIENISAHTQNAFIAIEDRRFYSHHGVDYLRIGKAVLNNIKSFSYKEGASTISQQLIKNTMLSSEKNLNRKAKEIRLAMILEKKYTKAEILEMYLNTVYFGENIYGIGAAANNYFNKNVSDLTIAESAMLAGLLASPNTYSPYNSRENAEARKSLVLDKMFEYDMISFAEFEKAANEKITVKRGNNKYASYLSQALSEFKEKTRYDFYGGQYKIYTYLDKNMQEYFEEDKANDCKKSYVLIDNSDYAVSAFYANSPIERRSPASAVKPVLVYAPAIEFDIVTPSSFLDDSKTVFENFSPSNYNNKYYGMVSVKTSLSESLNIPAVKILNHTGINKSKRFAKKLGIPFEKEDNSLALALGGFTKGVTLKELTNAYLAFSNGGKYAKAEYISKITDHNGKTVYSRKMNPVRAMQDSTAYLVTDMLRLCAESGTASKIHNKNYEIAAKTGTNGNENGNLDAYCISYTTQNCLGIWYGNNDGEMLSNDITGGNVLAEYSKEIYDKIYSKKPPPAFTRPAAVDAVPLDKISYQSDKKAEIASPDTPEGGAIMEYFKRGKSPKIVSDRYTVPRVDKTEMVFKDYTVEIKITPSPKFYYRIYKLFENKKNLIYEIKNCEVQKVFTDNDLEYGGKYVYSIIPYMLKSGKEIAGEEYFYPEINVPINFLPAS